ncbi:MAG TPA: phenylalanine--tRNA ligase subunit beta, partial [Woeseiaceae bacterium]|nr:phenylalanine--tRNA ligase subunit beta [Woeseiaceae bacterium]
MNIADSWLREWVDPEIDAAAVAERLTLAGHEVDGLHREGAGLDGVIVGEVLRAEPHPNADRLRVCSVSTGEGEPVQVVCGAPNVVAGMRSPLALPGTRLPNGVKLRRSKIRGIESQGMLCSAIELGLGDESDGILELPQSAKPGQALAALLQLPDTVFELNLTPNRGDCFSVRGIARDLAALTGAALAGPPLQALAPNGDGVQRVELPDASACPRFAARVIRDIDPAARSPLWMTERLRRSGVRAIHPVVDVTNYVMLELGQPLHAYDLDKLTGAVRPRFAQRGEGLTLLDERHIDLDTDTVVISDDSGVIGLAGVMGGLRTAVSEATVNVFLEAAYWPPAVMAGRARRYGLHTDASLRFERGVDPQLPPLAIERASRLLVEIAGGRAGPSVDHVHEEQLPLRTAVFLRRARLRQVLGVDLDTHDVTSILGSLQLGVEERQDGWLVTPPGFRFDIVIEEDLIEEVVRIFGYDRIAEATAVAETPLAGVTETRVDPETVADTLVSRDYQEVITYSFVEAGIDRLMTGADSELVLCNPISSEMSVMRGSLWSGLLLAARANLSRQQERVRLFEFGKSFHGTLASPQETPRLAGLALGPVLAEQWGSAPLAVDFYDVKADLEALFAATGEAASFAFEAHGHPALQPGQTARIVRDGVAVGWLGKLHPAIARQLEIRKDTVLFELDAEQTFAARVPESEAVSKFPIVRRDIAVVVDEAVSAADLRAAVVAAIPKLVRDVHVFDVYRGPGIEAGLKSVALGLILQETSR